MREPMDDIFRKLDEHQQKHRVSHWEGTFRDYLPLALNNPQLAQLAHARVYNMVRSYGVDTDEHGTEGYLFFERELFGIDDALAKVKEGYCAEYANELLKYVSSLLAREK
jgi:serine protein kinase